MILHEKHGDYNYQRALSNIADRKRFKETSAFSLKQLFSEEGKEFVTEGAHSVSS